MVVGPLLVALEPLGDWAFIVVLGLEVFVGEFLRMKVDVGNSEDGAEYFSVEGKRGEFFLEGIDAILLID